MYEALWEGGGKAIEQLTRAQARTFYGIDLKTLNCKQGNGMEKSLPARDLAGTQWALDEAEKKKAAAEEEQHAAS